MLMPGPRITDRLQARASWASACPIRRSRSGFQAEATAEAVGKQVAGTDPPSPTWSPSPGWARSPCGPSETMILGIPSRSTGAVYQKEEPLVSDAFSSSVSSVSRWSMSSVTGYHLLDRQPRHRRIAGPKILASQARVRDLGVIRVREATLRG